MRSNLNQKFGKARAAQRLRRWPWPYLDQTCSSRKCTAITNPCKASQTSSHACKGSGRKLSVGSRASCTGQRRTQDAAETLVEQRLHTLPLSWQAFFVLAVFFRIFWLLSFAAFHSSKARQLRRAITADALVEPPEEFGLQGRRPKVIQPSLTRRPSKEPCSRY